MGLMQGSGEGVVAWTGGKWEAKNSLVRVGGGGR